MVMATCVATDIKDQVVGKRFSPPAFDNSNYIKNRRGVPIHLLKNDFARRTDAIASFV